MKRSPIILILVAAFVLLAGTALADMSKKVISTFKGQILVTDHELEMAATDKDTIAEFKKARLKDLKGSPNSEEVQSWTFNYAAFLNKTGSTDLKLEFYIGDKYVADQRLTDVDPKDPVLVGQITITEDDGPTKGKAYVLKLVSVKGDKEVVLASTPLTLN